MCSFEAFLTEAKQEGITIDVYAPIARFVFDCNEGQIATPKEVQKVQKLVQIAQKHGCEQSLLTKIAECSTIEHSEFVWWARPYHVPANPNQWISLQDWLDGKKASS